MTWEENKSRRAFIAVNWLALCGVGFWAQTEALGCLKRDRAERDVSLDRAGATGAEAF